jgi:acetoin utilization protein AcuB
MTRSPVTVTPRNTLAKAQALMRAGGFRRVPVVSDGELVGILSERDLRQHLGYLESTRVDGAMTAAPMTVSSQMSVQDAARLLLEHKVGGLPVVDGGKLVGIVTTGDLLHALLDVIQATEEVLDG